LVERFVSSRSNTALISHFDCPGGGQVWVEGTTLFIGHMHWPSGTTIVDVADPRHPRKLATIDLPQGWHSHKVRVANGIMIVNHERLGESGPAEFGGGIAIYDVSRPSTPKLITKWRTAGRGVHRYDFDGRYAYLSPTAEGYVGNIMMILDLADPARPVEVGRWWIPGQWKAGGEPYPWDNWPEPRCHHPLRMGNRLYVSYWHHGLFILTCRGRKRWRIPIPARRLRTRRTPVCRFRSRSRAAASWWWRTRTSPSCGRRHPPSPGFTTSRSSNCRCRSRHSR
jgi:hypothetical protein